MTLDKFIEQLQEFQSNGFGDLTVTISVTNCLSCNSTVPVNNIQLGFDWASNRLLLTPDQPLERYYTESQKKERQETVEKILKGFSRKNGKNDR